MGLGGIIWGDLLVFIVAFLMSFLTVPLIIRVSHKKRLFSIPGRRHIHKKPTPKLGGVSIALGVFVALFFLLPKDRVTTAYFASSVLVLLAGVVDDVKNTSWKVKFLISMAAISILVFGGNIWIRSLGDLFGTGEVRLGAWGIPFTYFAVFGIINAINLIDGLNGLACGVSTIAFMAFAALAYASGNLTVFYLSLANLGGILGLFRYNYPRASIFMGDSGSLFIGFSLSAMAILLTHGATAVDPMVPVIILALPIFDTLRVMFFRMSKKRHPFHPDKTHVHHLLMRSGIPPLTVVRLMWVLSLFNAALAFALWDLNAWQLLLSVIVIVVVLSLGIENLKIVRLKKARQA